MKKIYNKMIKEGKSYREMVNEIEPKITAQGLYGRIKKFCSEHNLELPRAKRGAKKKNLILK